LSRGGKTESMKSRSILSEGQKSGGTAKSSREVVKVPKHPDLLRRAEKSQSARVRATHQGMGKKDIGLGCHAKRRVSGR